MTSFFTVLLLVIAAIGANIVYAIYPKIPLAFYEIGAGVLLSLVPIFNNFHIEPEVFMLIIIAPLMFNDGQSTDFHTLKKHFNSTLSLAVVLALVTILVGGLLTHAIWSVLPLTLCFALAAIVTPTDAVAVSSITTNIDVPEHVMGSLENESLFNDASGIVALDLALTAFTTGKFSLSQGIEHFVVVFFGGIIVGIILGMAIVFIRILFQRRALDTIAVILPFNLLTPFIVYLAAEHLHLSGILAVVAAGLVHGIQQSRLRLTSTQTQVVTKTTWEVVANLLNGFVFVLLGASGPSVWNDLSASEAAHLPVLVVIAVSLYLLMGLLRFLWCMLNLVTLAGRETRLKDAFILSLSGVHGTITLAMAFSLPLVVAGQAFPYRSAIILVAGMIILLSLIMPTLILPIVLPTKQAAFTPEEFSDQMVRMVNFAIEQLRHTGQNTAALPAVIEVLNGQKNESKKNADSKLVHQLLEQAEQAEHVAVNELIENGELQPQIGWQYNRAAMFQTQFAFLSPWARVKMWVRLIEFRLFPHRARNHYQKKVQRSREAKQAWLKEHGYLDRHQHHENPEHPANVNHHQQREIQLAKITGAQLPANQSPRQSRARPTFQQRRELRRQTRNRQLSEENRVAFTKAGNAGYNGVINFLDSIETDDNRQEVDVVRHYYNVRHQRFNLTESTSDEENELFIMAFQFEYSYVQTAGKQEHLSDELIAELHKKISMDQLVYMQNGN